jgi:hypothetical protein
MGRGVRCGLRTTEEGPPAQIPERARTEDGSGVVASSQSSAVLRRGAGVLPGGGVGLT